MEKLLSFNQVMDITGYSRPRIYELIKQGLFPRKGNDSNLLIVFYVQIMPDDFVMQLHRF
ncbi:Predicted transcriptional regulator [Klebsiella pneumoniae]|nr:Predicted transcriptional regulator [Klebsiella pneumoniae]SWA44737.1 Predicted transcriptional regulator [Klebsiella pneumoniae]